MTLFKQVALIVSLVFLLIVVSTTVGDYKRSSSFVEGQLQSTAQDMATTLGMAISNSTTEVDLVAYETLFNAVFDSGYYTSIELVSSDGAIIHRKDRELEIKDVPDWFIRLVPLQPATGVTEVMQGWVPLGTLRLTMHPGYVYSSLYKNLEATLLWSLVLISFGLVVLWLLLHHLLKPLNQVKQQADAVHNNQFIKQPFIPHTVELRSVVEAMNRMVEKVHVIFDDQEKTLARYQKLLYEDELTGLGNRQYFMGQLVQALSDESSFHGNLAVIKILNLDYIHDHYGYEKSDAVLIAMGGILKTNSGSNTIEQYARLSDDEFSLLVPTNLDVIAYFEKIFECFKSHADIVDIKDDVSLVAGISSVQIGDDVGATLAEVDFALMQALTSGPYSIKEKISTNIALPQGKIQWRSWLERSIADEKLFLVGQKVLNDKGQAIHQEIFVRLKNYNGQTVPAGIFMPTAIALDLGKDIDRTVFRLVKQLGRKAGDVPIALNLTASVFSHADTLVEFNMLLEYFQKSSSMLCVEASHAILEQYPEMCAEVAESIRYAGHKFGIDNLNFGLTMRTLQSVRPDYVKVNANTLYDMTRDEVHTAYQALHTLTSAMDIRLVAVGVDSQVVHDHLRELGVDAMQGNLLSEAEELL